MKMPEKYFRNNTANTLSLLETMLECGVTRLVFSSTAALNGAPEQIPIEEDDALKPNKRVWRIQASGRANAHLVSSDSRPTLRQSALF